MKWFDLTEEERKEWRDDPRTQAYVATLRERIEEKQEQSMNTLVSSGDARGARIDASVAAGIAQAIDIMEEQ